MQVSYKGFELTVTRDKSRDDALDYSILRESDGLKVTDGTSFGEDKISDFVGHLKGIVDDFLEDPTAYYAEMSDNELSDDDLPPDDYEEYQDEEFVEEEN